jgi:hypothetical protein
MTTHDEQTKTTSTSTADVDPSARLESSNAGTEPSADSPATRGEPLTTGDESSSAAGTESSAMETTASSTARSEPSTAKSLFADDLSGLRGRWDDVQAAFVDAPKECVQKADALVAEVVEQLTTGFSEARSRLEAHWARGEDASTEDLRLALKRYREFFRRLLSV